MGGRLQGRSGTPDPIQRPRNGTREGGRDGGNIWSVLVNMGGYNPMVTGTPSIEGEGTTSLVGIWWIDGYSRQLAYLNFPVCKCRWGSHMRTTPLSYLPTFAVDALLRCTTYRRRLSDEAVDQLDDVLYSTALYNTIQYLNLP